MCVTCRNLCLIRPISTATTVFAHTARPVTWPPDCQAASPTSPLSITTQWLCSATVPPAPPRIPSVKPSDGPDAAWISRFYWYDLTWIKRYNQDILVCVGFFIMQKQLEIYFLNYESLKVGILVMSLVLLYMLWVLWCNLFSKKLAKGERNNVYSPW